MCLIDIEREGGKVDEQLQGTAMVCSIVLIRFGYRRR